MLSIEDRLFWVDLEIVSGNSNMSLYVIHIQTYSKHNIFTHFQICKNPGASMTKSRQSGRDLWGQCALELLPLLESCAANTAVPNSGFGRSKQKIIIICHGLGDVSVVYFVAEL